MRILGLQVPPILSENVRAVQDGVSSYFDGPFLLRLQGRLYIRWPRSLSKQFLRSSRADLSETAHLIGLKDVRLWTLLLTPLRLRGCKMGILVPEFLGRTGNNLVQVRNAIAVAVKTNIGSVLTAGELAISGRPIFTREIIVSGDMSAPKKRADQDKHSQNFILVEADWFRPPKGIQVSSDQLSEAQEIIVSALFSAMGIANPLLDKEKCVIHYRTGDVFGPEPHKRYGPPPHSYYLALLRKWNLNEVTLVCEHPKEPVVLSLIEQLEAAQISVFAGKRTLQEDILHILSCTHLVSSQGTFSISLGSLNPHLTHFGYFESSHGHEFWHPMSPSCRKWVVSDKSGLFSRQIHHANWRNTEQQSDLVRNYPISNLSVE